MAVGALAILMVRVARLFFVQQPLLLTLLTLRPLLRAIRCSRCPVAVGGRSGSRSGVCLAGRCYCTVTAERPSRPSPIALRRSSRDRSGQWALRSAPLRCGQPVAARPTVTFPCAAPDSAAVAVTASRLLLPSPHCSVLRVTARTLAYGAAVQSQWHWLSVAVGRVALTHSPCSR